MNWPAASLGDVCEIVSGATPRTEEKQFWDGGIPWTTPKDISELETPYLERTPRTISEAGLRSCAAKLLPPESVLLSSRAPIGLVAINKLPVATNQGFKSLVPEPRKLDSKFLYHWLKSKTGYLQSLGNGATFKEISKAVVERIEIPLPPLSEQRRIAAILDKADALRRKRKRALELLDGLTQSIFLEMFGEATHNPHGFAKAKLGDLCEFRGGSQPPKSTFTYEPGPGKVRLVQIRDYKTDAFATYIPKELAKRSCTATDVMIGRYGPPLFQILKGIEGSYNVALMKAVPKPGIYRSFIFYLLRSPKLQADVIAQSERSAGQTGVNLKFLNDYPAYVPSEDMQARFDRFVDTYDNVVDKMKCEDACGARLFSSLESRAFSGQL